MADTLTSDAGVASKGLKGGSLGLVAVIVIGVASTAPGYSLAASIGFVTGEVGTKAPFIMLFAFVPMACIAASFYLDYVAAKIQAPLSSRLGSRMVPLNRRRRREESLTSPPKWSEK